MQFTDLEPRSRDQEVINDVLWKCTGSELQLLDCSQNQSDVNCSDLVEAGVYCYGKPKLSMITAIDLSIQASTIILIIGPNYNNIMT